MVENDNVVKIEVDMEPLKMVFENVAEGFADQAKAIQKLRFFQGVLAVGLIGQNILMFVIR